MTQNRTIPYGYRKENGKIHIEKQESAVVSDIYRRYARGESYKSIAEHLTAQGLRYIADKPLWNKNMVARILQNEKYLGAQGFPAIVDAQARAKSEAARKAYTHTESAEIKTLKPLLMCDVCGLKLKRRIKSSGTERWYCPNDVDHISVSLRDDILVREVLDFLSSILEGNTLKQHPHKLTSLEIIELENRIERMGEEEHVEYDAIEAAIKKLAELEFSLCEKTNHTLENSFEKLQADPQKHFSEIANCFLEIRVRDCSVLGVLLKNGNKVRKGVEQNE